MGDAVRHVVSRLNWRFDKYGPAAGGWVRSAGGVRVAAFDTADAAYADRDAREAAARRRVNPFACGDGLADLTPLAEPLLRDWLLDHGIDPPAGSGLAAWRAWWERANEPSPPPDLTAVWDAVSKVRFYAVEERPVRPVVYAVVEVGWAYNDEWNYREPGGAPVTAYRSRERAEAEAARLDAEARRRWAGATLEQDSAGAEDPFAAADQPDDHRPTLVGADAVRFYEVAEIEWEGAE
jgi:hypothetical protein